MASPPSPRSRPQDGSDIGRTGLSSPTRPSPALSAYSYNSSNSSDTDFELGALKLDDFDDYDNEPVRPVASRSDKTLYGLLRNIASGSSTPVPGTLSRASTGHVQQYLKDNGSRQSSVDAESPDALDLEEDEEAENDVDGFDVEDEDEEDMHANGVPAARGWRLDARKSETKEFREQVLKMFSTQLKIDSWAEDTVDQALLPLQAENVVLKRISGAFSNAVFFVSYKCDKEAVSAGPKTVLLRVYGVGTAVLLSRRAELLILHTLSSLYEIGPHILGTFANGRVETFFDAEPIGKDGVRDLGDRKETIKHDDSLYVRGKEGRAQWVARRMRQLHEVPLDTMRTVLEQGDLRVSGDSGSVFGRGIENHLFARSHRPKIHQRSSSAARSPPAATHPLFDPSRMMRQSPGPMATEESTNMQTTGAEAARAEAMAIRGYAPHRNNSVASFDSLATSYNSQDSYSSASTSNENLLSSPYVAPTSSQASSYVDSVNAARSNRHGSHASPPLGRPSRFSSGSSGYFRQSSSTQQPYPGMWRRSKRWAREAAKVLALVDEFCSTSKGQKACAKALSDTPYCKVKHFSPFMDFDVQDRVHSIKLGTAVSSLCNTLLAIAAIDFPRLLAEMDAFKRFIRRWEKKYGMSRRVLAHGDTQYSNLLLIKEGTMQQDSAGKGMPRERSRERGGVFSGAGGSGVEEDGITSVSSNTATSKLRSKRIAPYERLIVIDFEYCSPNPRAYDIANAFHEWRFDYHHATDCWSPYTLPYPTRDERRRWLRAYVEQGRLIRMRGKAPKTAFDTLGQTSPSVGGVGSGSGMPLEDLKLPPAVNSKESVERRSQSPLHRASSAETATPSPGFGPQPNLTSPAMRAVLDGGAIASPVLSARTSLASLEASMEREIERLEREVEVFSPACHASWALWGITFAKENIELIIRSVLDNDDEEDDGENTLEGIPKDVVLGSAESFDNLRYSLSRVELFREEITKLGITLP